MCVIRLIWLLWYCWRARVWIKLSTCWIVWQNVTPWSVHVWGAWKECQKKDGGMQDVVTCREYREISVMLLGSWSSMLQKGDCYGPGSQTVSCCYGFGLSVIHYRSNRIKKPGLENRVRIHSPGGLLAWSDYAEWMIIPCLQTLLFKWSRVGV